MRRLAGRVPVAIAGGLTLFALTTGCTRATHHVSTASDVVASLGAVAIPTAGDGPATPTSSVGNPQLVAMGAPLHVLLDGGVDAIVTATGPEELTPYEGGSAAPPSSTVGIITVSVRENGGTLPIRAEEFTSRDETGEQIALRPQGASTATAVPGSTASLKMAGTFDSGAAQITWRHDGHVLAIWDFNIELD